MLHQTLCFYCCFVVFFLPPDFISMHKNVKTPQNKPARKSSYAKCHSCTAPIKNTLLWKLNGKDVMRMCRTLREVLPYLFFFFFLVICWTFSRCSTEMQPLFQNLCWTNAALCHHPHRERYRECNWKFGSGLIDAVIVCGGLNRDTVKVAGFICGEKKLPTWG